MEMCHHGVAGRMFNTFQRRLIYYPTREPRIEPQDVDLPAGHVHTVVLTTDDGLELRGWHILPGGRLAVDRKACNQILEAGGRVVLFFSGNAANRRLRAAEFLVLAALGLHVFIFDYRGYGDNPGEPSEERLADDAHSMWEYLVFERHLSPDRILLYGESLGGAVAIRLADDLGQGGVSPAGLLLRSTFTSLVDVARHHFPWLPVRLCLVDRYPSISYISRVVCPLLQFHGGRDAITPLKYGRRLFDQAPDESSTGIAKQFIELPQAGHNDVMLVALEEFTSRIAHFLRQLDEGKQSMKSP
jgi:pimeloyl-ACP methyl ester carboxylesterase